MTAIDLHNTLVALGTPARAKANQWFFKTGPGEYGEGDRFIGVTLPQIREVVKKFRNLALSEIKQLLKSKLHEERLISLILLVEQFKKADILFQREIYTFYLSHTKYINNWDLVDCSAGYIVGPFIEHGQKNKLLQLAHSKSLWERRISMIATFYLIKQGKSEIALEIATILVHDDQDLIQKAVGWMLREVGKRCDVEIEETFLKKHYKTMPRTMLRYAIEHFSPEKKAFFMKK